MRRSAAIFQAASILMAEAIALILKNLILAQYYTGNTGLGIVALLISPEFAEAEMTIDLSPFRKSSQADPVELKFVLFYANTVYYPIQRPAHLSHHLRLFFFSAYQIYNRQRLWQYPIESLPALPFYHYRHHVQKP
jgi:hypothetical protein